MKKYRIILTEEEHFYLGSLIKRDEENCLIPKGINFLNHLYNKILTGMGCACDECKELQKKAKKL